MLLNTFSVSLSKVHMDVPQYFEANILWTDLMGF